jgi:D-alanyl-D-alanine carboxypeptidase
MGRASVSI